jgi:hypothetical protein
MVAPAASTLPTTRRSEASSGNNGFGYNEILNRALNGAGGDRTNFLFSTSFVVLFVVIIIFANSGKVSPDASRDTYIDIGTTNLKAPETHRQVQKRPRDISLLIVGNSTARYSYLSLAYFLRWGRWFDPGLEKSNLVNEVSFDNPFHESTFDEFYFQTNIMLQPYELCDCHKSHKHPDMRKYIIENRYFHDPEHNNTVTFIQSFGDEAPTRGRLKVEDLYTSRWKWSTKEKGLLDPTWSIPEWSYDTWDEFITEYVGKMNPKPENIAFTAGRFNNSFGPDDNGKESADKIALALQQEKIRGFWKTTNYDSSHSLEDDVGKLDAFMCGLLGNCLDHSWTKGVRSELYWDESHFFEPVYRAMNEEMLEAMGYLPEGYVKYDRSQLTK